MSPVPSLLHEVPVEPEAHQHYVPAQLCFLLHTPVGTYEARRTIDAPVWGVQAIAPGVMHGSLRAYAPAASDC